MRRSFVDQDERDFQIAAIRRHLEDMIVEFSPPTQYTHAAREDGRTTFSTAELVARLGEHAPPIKLVESMLKSAVKAGSIRRSGQVWEVIDADKLFDEGFRRAVVSVALAA